MKILVSGGTGYIGSHTAVELIKAKHEVTIFDNLFNSKIEVLDKIKKITGTKPKFFNTDLLDKAGLDKIFQSDNFDLVMHFAGLKAVAESIEKPLWYYQNNVGGTINLLQCMKKYKVKNFIFSSSATVYGKQKTPKLNENMKTGINLTNPYGKTKYVIEEILKDLVESNNEFKIVILRYFNPIGAHPSGLIGEDPNDIPNNLMPIIVKVSQGIISELSIYGNDYNTLDGTGIRDYIHVVDLAKGHLSAINGLNNGVSIYNLGTGKNTSVLEMVSAFEKASGKKLPYKFMPRRKGDLAEVYADPTKAEKELGWKTELTIKDAMQDIINFLDIITN